MGKLDMTVSGDSKFLKVMERSKYDLSVAFSSLIAALILHRIAYSAGYSVNPTLSAICSICAFWILVSSAVFVTFPWRRWHGGASCMLRVVLGVSCVAPLFVPGFRGDDAFQRFTVRMKEDINPRQLSSWLKAAVANNPAGQYRRLSVSEWRIFGKTNADYPLPILYTERNEGMIWWVMI
jgi:hypothetical protein